ncbi:hypothetical protein, partial [Nocardia heshunensis]
DTSIELVNNTRWSNTSATSTSLVTFTVPAGVVQGYIRIDNNGSADGKDASVYLISVQMVQATHRVPMAPAFSDFVRDNGDGTVTINGNTFVPADNANVSHRNPNTGVISEKSDFTQLTVSGGKTVATSDDLKSVAQSAWYPITVNSEFTSTPFLMKYDSKTGVTKIIGGMKISWDKTKGTWTNVLMTLPVGFHFIKNMSLPIHVGTIDGGNNATTTVTGRNLVLTFKYPYEGEAGIISVLSWGSKSFWQDGLDNWTTDAIVPD